ncbi:MAG: HlyD family type I secretion periplasmic adaptor subunit [Hyphomicrobiaceae bacterium]|nr:HlyD family type I secretion periplasmic adaptor subunit [Hyphomicrobiaceae bacterium]
MRLPIPRNLSLASATPAALPAVPPRIQTTEDLWPSTEPWIGHGKYTVLGLGAVILLFGLISINGAVVTQGTVTVESNYKTIQHLDGGIVQKILVKNGDHVKSGDVIVRLDDTQVRANLGVARGRYLDALTQKLRLEAERDEKPSFKLPATIGPDLDDPHILRLYDAQHTLFLARRTSQTGEQNMLRQRVEQITTDLAGLTRQSESRDREYGLNERELKNVLPLFEKGFVNQQRLSPLQRDQVRLEGELNRIKSDIAKARSGVAEAEMKLAQGRKEFQSQIAEELRKVEGQLNEATESKTALEDKISRTEIRAPRAGRIHALAPTTEGGVIGPGTAIAQIIPDGEKLIIEAKIQPQDIDKVRGGLPASIRFPSFDAKTTPRLDGIVTTVSPAQLKDQDNQNRPYFMAQIELPAHEIEKIGRQHRLVPGMPAEVYIETNARTILSYIMKPIMDLITPMGRDG